MAETILRRHPLDALPGTADPRLVRLEPMTRLSLQAPDDALAFAGAALGLSLPTEPCRAARSDRCSALWLGPAEWLILSAEAADGLMAELKGEFGPAPHSLVDISHRQTAIAVTGAAAADMLSAGCPLDLDLGAFPAGMCTRTLFGKAEIVLWRTDPDRFHLEIWRSFAPYVWTLLTVVGREYRYQSDDQPV
jgi:sarcosine oxidase subunit gamma